ncbi:site-specific integrase [Micromonospora sp. WP24]|uniref:tyrosine-type recombinase/integrase n=1 Tax=Micromonospora sp. WP24 TaxID=2604469 RepID=UPI0011D9AD24|nr:tyrosine-type recombinase/integrase [Micromonospora sp. WP24]TYB92200.1 site-specific integrase [Micromonospora sp. WP24]
MTGRRRRSRGEGSVYEQRPGVWAAVVDLGWIDGKRKRKYVYAKSEAEAVRKRDELRRQLQLGVDLSAQPRTLEAWLTEWLRDVKAHDGTRPSTLVRYRLAVSKHLVPGLGRVKLDRLTPRDVQRFLTGLRGKLAPASIIKVHAVLRVALADAERMDLVPRNVAKAAKPPALGRTERRALTPEEAKTLLSVLTGDRLESLFVLALVTGLRRAELLGLRWSDVDLSGKALFVRQTLQRTDHGLVFVPPKTHRSSRPLPLSALAVRALEAQRVRQAKERLAAGEVWSDLGLVFASTIGTAMEPRNVNRRFEQLRAAAGLDWLHLHDLRHAFATFLLDQGEELRTVMELLGHSTIRMTADTYGHVLPARARQAASAIDRVLGQEETA